jgi:hypothetical protein
MQTYELRFTAQGIDHVVGTQQAQGAYHAQERVVLGQRGRQQRGDDNQVGQSDRVENHVQALWTDEESCEEFQQVGNADRLFDHMQLIDVMKERGDDEIQDSQAVEGQQRPAKNMRPPAMSVIQVVYVVIELLPGTGARRRYVVHAIPLRVA